MAQTYDTVIFDLDGTLLDTLDDLTDSVNAALRQCGLRPHTRDEICSYVGDGVKMLIRRALPENSDETEYQAVMDAYLDHYRNNMQNKTQPYLGIPELLEALHARHVKMAVVSNKHDEAVSGLVHDYFGDWIGQAVGAGEGVPTKPDPSGLQKAMALLGSTAEHTLYMGDSGVDIVTAKNAGVLAVGCAWGFRGRAALEAANADVVIDSPTDLLAQVTLQD